MTRTFFLQKNSFLLLFFLCCSLPVLAAKIALQFGWFTPGVTSKGQWFEQDIQLITEPDTKHWHLVYIQAQECTNSCELALYTLQQLYSGLGAHQARVNLQVITTQAPAQLARFPNITWKNNALIDKSPWVNQLVIANPQGIALLHYPIDPTQILITAKGIRSDLLRLLAYDRNGI